MTSALHEARLEAVRDVILAARARSVLDLGCGDGALLALLVADPSIERLVGLDVSLEALALARERLGAAAAPGGRVGLLHGSFAQPDPRLAGFAAATLVETIEHVAPEQLSAVEHAVFGCWRPGTVVVTTPNRDYNELLGVPAHRHRHPEHRFEWGRERFATWARGIAVRRGYAVRLGDLGPCHPERGGPSQIATFTRPPA